MGQFQVNNEYRRETAVVVGNLRQGEEAEQSLLEIRELLTTAGVDTVGELAQRRDKPHPRTYIGEGKLQELKELVEQLDPDIVVIDEDLSPSQQRTLEDTLERGVLDRTAVILDIFALHAHTAEGKLQVELAQLEYNMSRMRGMWKHLERLGGGVGTRGPGESQLETDRRLARGRITMLKKQLGELSERRHTRRKQRQQSIIPNIALAGYTNAGKSTLLNALTGSAVSMENRLFETLDPTTRSYEKDGRRYLLTDTVGFIERLPHQLVNAFKSTLEETQLADLILLVADASQSEEMLGQHITVVRDVLAQIDAGDIPTLVVLNKVDRLDTVTRERLGRRYPDAVFIAAKTGLGLSDLAERIAAHFASRWTEVELLVPYGDAGLLSELYDAGAPVTRKDEEDGIHAWAHLPERLLKRVAPFRVDEGGPGARAVIAENDGTVAVVEPDVERDVAG